MSCQRRLLRRFGRGWGLGPKVEKLKIKNWFLPVTNHGYMVKYMKIKSLEDNCLDSLPVKEPKIIGFFLGILLEDEILKIMPVQKETRQYTTFKAFVATNDYGGHVDLGVKCSRKSPLQFVVPSSSLSCPSCQSGVANGVTKMARPTVPCKVMCHCGSVLVHLIPAPHGTRTVSVPVP